METKTTTNQNQKIEIKPCPFCGGTDLEFIFVSNRNFGYTDFEYGRIFCKTCSGSKGDVFGAGKPTKDHELKAWNKWNERNND